MPRAAALDPLHNFRFHAEAYLSDGTDALKHVDEAGAQAGFNAVGVPEISVEPVEYKEGTDKYKKRYPGAATWSDTLTLSRGVMKTDTSFYDWIVAKVIGGGEYRADLTIYHMHRDAEYSLSKARLYKCFEAFPTRVKLGADLDSTSSDVSVAEIDITYEYAEMDNPK